MLHFSTFKLQFQGDRILITGLELGTENVAIYLVKIFIIFLFFKGVKFYKEDICNITKHLLIIIGIMFIYIILGKNYI